MVKKLKREGGKTIPTLYIKQSKPSLKIFH